MIKRNILIILTFLLFSCNQKNKEQKNKLIIQKNNIKKIESSMKYDIFLEKLDSILQGEHNFTSEEEYFRRLLFQVESNSSKKVTPNLLLDIFKKSLTSSESIKFNEDWNKLKEPIPFPDSKNISAKEDLDFTKKTIQFFVADLRRLGNKVLKDPYRGYGVTSSSGARWYNYDIFSIFNGWYSLCNDGNAVSTEDNNEDIYLWRDISDILLFGKEYE